MNKIFKLFKKHNKEIESPTLKEDHKLKSVYGAIIRVKWIEKGQVLVAQGKVINDSVKYDNDGFMLCSDDSYIEMVFVTHLLNSTDDIGNIPDDIQNIITPHRIYIKWMLEWNTIYGIPY